MDLEKLGWWIRYRGMTEAELARLSGVSQGTVNRWRHGRSKPTRRAFAAVAAVLGVQVAELEVVTT